MPMKPFIYRDQELEGQRLELTDLDGHYLLGPNLILRRCTLVMRASRGWLHIDNARLIDCTIETKHDMKSFQDWKHAVLIGCRFTGRIPGCEFGGRPDSSVFKGGHIEHCDFTQTRLHQCRFHSCDIRTLRFPPWPCFTFLEPLKRMNELAAVSWPGNVWKDTVEGIPDRSPPSTVALTYHGPTLARECGITPEELKAFLETLDFIAC